MSAWCKTRLGWVVNTIIGPGSYDAPQVESSPTVFRIQSGFPTGEYLLIENREPTGFEKDMPQGGLAIWHIDESKANNNTEGYPSQTGWPRNGNHYTIALLQADGRYDLEHGANRGDSGDLYRGTDVSLIGADTTPNTYSYQSGNARRTGNIISGISIAGSVMSFVFSAPSPAPPAIEVAATIGQWCLPDLDWDSGQHCNRSRARSGNLSGCVSRFGATDGGLDSTDWRSHCNKRPGVGGRSRGADCPDAVLPRQRKALMGNTARQLCSVFADPMSTLANSSVGRMLLHFICLVRHPAHLKWHLRGIGREIGIHAHATTL